MTRDHHCKWPQFEWTADALIEHHPSRTFIYGRWDRLFDCWQITNDAFGLQPFVPHWPLLDCTGALTLQGSPTPAPTEEWEETLLQDKSYFLAAEWEAHFSYDVSIDETADRELDAAAQHAFQMYIELVPLRTRRLAAPFLSWQWVVLAMISDRPTFAEFLASELRSIGPGFVVGCLALSRADTLSRSERRALCHQIMVDKRALLVGRLAGIAPIELLVRCLAKLQLDALECASWSDFIRMMGDRNKARVVSHVKVLTPTIVRLLSRLPSWICSVPLLLRLIESPEHLREEATALVMNLGTLITTQSPAVKAAFTSSLKQAEDGAHLINILIRWRQRIADRAPFPRPPIPGTDVLTPLTSVKMI